MTKNEIDNKERLNLRNISIIMSNRLNLPSATAYDCTKCIFSIISECLRENKVVTINNFGSFQVKKTKERRIYVPSERAYRIKNSFNKVNFKSRINF